MGRFGLHDGVFFNGAAALIAGAGGVRAVTAADTFGLVLGWAGIILGIGLFIWGVEIDGKQWWRKRVVTPAPPPATLAAPLQYNNPVTAGAPRYDDEHRGPVVSDAYSLSECWIDLAGCADEWPFDGNAPPGLIEFAERVPEDQRVDWVRRECASQEVIRLISEAMRSGTLPIWVAPIGGPEQEVDPKALLEIDRATIASGCYRPHNDRGWLFGCPLFVKRTDWVQFRNNVRRVKGIARRAKGRS